MNNILKNAKMRTKVLLAPVIGIFIIGVLGGIFYFGLLKQKEIINSVLKKGFYIYQESLKVSNDLLRIHSNVYKILTWKQSGYSDDKIKQFADLQILSIDKVNENVNSIIKSGLLNNKELEFFKKTLSNIKDYKENVTATIASVMGGDTVAATSLLGMGDDSFQEFNKGLQKFLKNQNNNNKVLQKKSDDSFNKFKLTIGILIVASVVLMLFISFFIAYIIVKPIKDTISVLRNISEGEGDLTLQLDVKSKDEIGEFCVLFNSFITKISGIIRDVKKSTNTVVEASLSIGSVSQSLSQSANEQAANMEEISSSMDEMSSSIMQNSENSKKTNDIAQRTALKAEEGGKAVKEAVEAMRMIVGKISLIEDIAYQTNLLALNAAIEAARAGAHGKGFAVVAGEVRKLAEKSQSSAKEINELVTSSVKISERAGELLEEIVPSIKETADLVQDITISSGEQNSGAEQINLGMDQLNELTQSNAASSEELASTADLLKSNASDLQKMVNFFKVNEEDIEEGKLLEGGNSG